MKNLLQILCCLMVVALSHGQITSQSQSLAQDSILYLTAEQEAFMIDKETKYLFKTGPLAYERKLTKAISLNIELSPRLRINSETSNLNGGIDLDANFELRNYFKLSKLIDEGKQANNLSSVYYGFGIGGSRSILGFFNEKNRVYGVIGSQKRFLNYGYADFGIKLSYEDQKFDEEDLSNFGQNISGYSLSNYSKIGFAFGRKYTINDEVKCPIFKCHLDQKSFFKLNYNKNFTIFYGDSFQKKEGKIFRVDINPNIGYEIKIGGSSFSFDQDLDMRILATLNDKIEYRIDYSAGIRYYYNLRKNMRRGKSGNNLSGYYTLVRGNYQKINIELLQFSLVNGELEKIKSKGSFLNVDIGIGYQKTLLNNLFFDISLGVSPRVYTFTKGATALQEAIFLDFKVGKFF